MEKVVKVRLERDPETGDLVLVFPPGFVKKQGWKSGDNISLDLREQKSAILNAVDRTRQTVTRE